MTSNIDIKLLLGKRIKELRVKRGLTQEQLSESIGICERNLSKIECGKSFVTAETLSNLIKALGIDIQDVFEVKHLKTNEELKAELIDAITNEKVDVQLLYKLYKAIQ